MEGKGQGKGMGKGEGIVCGAGMEGLCQFLPPS